MGQPFYKVQDYHNKFPYPNDSNSAAISSGDSFLFESSERFMALASVVSEDSFLGVGSAAANNAAISSGESCLSGFSSKVLTSEVIWVSELLSSSGSDLPTTVKVGVKEASFSLSGVGSAAANRAAISSGDNMSFGFLSVVGVADEESFSGMAVSSGSSEGILVSKFGEVILLETF